MSKTLTVKVRGSFQSFTSELSDARALEILENAGTRGELSTFGTSLVKQAHAWGARPLSAAQMAWVHKLALEFVAKSQPQAAGSEPEIEGGMQAIVELLTAAAERLKWPAITYRGLRISMAGPKHPGCVNVANDVEGGFQARTWYGRISAGGAFEAARTCPASVIETLVELASDPAAKTAAEGKATGCCCFCRRGLETAESLAVGYGPVCAEKYALPWGFPKAKRARKAKAIVPQGDRPAVAPSQPETVELPVQATREGFEQVAPGVWRRIV